MASQFDVFRTPQKPLVVVIQNDMLEEMRVRVVAPLLPAGHVQRKVKSLNPEIWVKGEAYLLMPQLMASFAVQELGEWVASVEEDRDKIIRAVDTLLAGV